MPDVPRNNIPGVAATLTRYCQVPGGTPSVDTLDPASAQLGQLQLLCVLLAPARTTGDPCDHTVGEPANTETLAGVATLASACVGAVERHQQALREWLDAGPPATCPGASSSAAPSSTSGRPSSGGVSVTGCPNPATDVVWENTWEEVGITCANCHNGAIPSANCFPITDQDAGQHTFCAYARQENLLLQRGGWQTSRLYLATHGANRRYECSGTTTPHESFMADLDARLEAWHNAIFP
jgi:hypothetical protein